MITEPPTEEREQPLPPARRAPGVAGQTRRAAGLAAAISGADGGKGAARTLGQTGRGHARARANPRPPRDPAARHAAADSPAARRGCRAASGRQGENGTPHGKTGTARRHGWGVAGFTFFPFYPLLLGGLIISGQHIIIHFFNL